MKEAICYLMLIKILLRLEYYTLLEMRVKSIALILAFGSWDYIIPVWEMKTLIFVLKIALEISILIRFAPAIKEINNICWAW